MKKSYAISIAFFIILLGSFVVYSFYLPGISCTDDGSVVATHRFIGTEAVFDDLCVVPFWYKDIREYNPEQPRAEAAHSLGVVARGKISGNVDTVFAKYAQSGIVSAT